MHFDDDRMHALLLCYLLSCFLNSPIEVLLHAFSEGLFRLLVFFRQLNLLYFSPYSIEDEIGLVTKYYLDYSSSQQMEVFAMKYTPHGGHSYVMKHVRATRIADMARTSVFGLSGITIGYLMVRLDFFALTLVILLTTAAIVAVYKTAEAERTKEFSFWRQYGKPQHLSYAQVGFHFEPSVPYHAELVKRLPMEDDHPDFLYLVENVPTGDHYLVRTFQELPLESFRCEYEDNTLQFQPHEMTVH